jgi:hypothetical protein
MHLCRLTPTITVPQFAGRVDVSSLTSLGIALYPCHEIGAHRMAVTLRELGPRPVIELHAAGLKIGEMSTRARLFGTAIEHPELLDLV